MSRVEFWLPEPVSMETPVVVACPLNQVPIGNGGWFVNDNDNIEGLTGWLPPDYEGDEVPYAVYIPYRMETPDPGGHGLAIYNPQGDVIYNSNVTEMIARESSQPEPKDDWYDPSQFLFSTTEMGSWFSISTVMTGLQYFPCTGYDPDTQGVSYGCLYQESSGVVDEQTYNVCTSQTFTSSSRREAIPEAMALIHIQDTSY